MTTEQFAYWLQGFTENNSEPPTKEQWENIKNHLALVFTKVTPNITPITTPVPIPFDGTKKPYEPPFEITCQGGNSNDVKFC